jgi:DinB superfamily
MDAQWLLLEQYDFVAMVSTGMVYAGLQGDQLRLHPQRQNSLAWLLWHATRWEDVVVNTWVAGQPQVLVRQDWLAHLRVPDCHCGTAMTPAEAAQVSAQVDLDALRAYRETVEARTRAVVTALSAVLATRASAPAMRRSPRKDKTDAHV